MMNHVITDKIDCPVCGARAGERCIEPDSRGSGTHYMYQHLPTGLLTLHTDRNVTRTEFNQLELKWADRVKPTIFGDGDPNHHCDDECVCPIDGHPLYWSRYWMKHACTLTDCLYAHGRD